VYIAVIVLEVENLAAVVALSFVVPFRYIVCASSFLVTAHASEVWNLAYVAVVVLEVENLAAVVAL
jgi:hypothetical protein